MKNKQLQSNYHRSMVIGLFLVFLTSCQTESMSGVEQRTEPTPKSSEPTQTMEMVSSLNAEESLTPEINDECVSCHIDKQALIDTAKPVVLLESENSGEG